jgi:prepilin-type N-terminal cleavage/methylation domain-containing protein
MTRYIRQKGFSLTEVLMAAGVLAIGLTLIAMAFPVGVKLTSVTTEQTIADAAYGEAVANMHLYADSLPAGFNLAQTPTIPATGSCVDFTGDLSALSGNVRFYPSLVPMPEEKRYCWSILVRRTDPNTNELQTTVFVCRIQGMNAKHYDMDAPPNPYVTSYNKDNPWPVPVKVMVNYTAFGKMITVRPNTQFDDTGKTLTACHFFTEGCMIIEDKTGYLYKVMETQDLSPKDGFRETLVLNKDFPNNGVAGPGFPATDNVDVWVVPPAVGSSRNPCISVTQTNIVF